MARTGEWGGTVRINVEGAQTLERKVRARINGFPEDERPHIFVILIPSFDEKNFEHHRRSSENDIHGPISNSLMSKRRTALGTQVARNIAFVASVIFANRRSRPSKISTLD